MTFTSSESAKSGKSRDLTSIDLSPIQGKFDPGEREQISGVLFHLETLFDRLSDTKGNRPAQISVINNAYQDLVFTIRRDVTIKSATTEVVFIADRKGKTKSHPCGYKFNTLTGKIVELVKRDEFKRLDELTSNALDTLKMDPEGDSFTIYVSYPNGGNTIEMTESFQAVLANL